MVGVSVGVGKSLNVGRECLGDVAGLWRAVGSVLCSSRSNTCPLHGLSCSALGTSLPYCVQPPTEELYHPHMMDKGVVTPDLCMAIT